MPKSRNPSSVRRNADARRPTQPSGANRRDLNAEANSEGGDSRNRQTSSAGMLPLAGMIPVNPHFLINSLMPTVHSSLFSPLNSAMDLLNSAIIAGHSGIPFSVFIQNRYAEFQAIWRHRGQQPPGSLIPDATMPSFQVLPRPAFRIISSRPRAPPAPVDLSQEVTHAAPMSPEQIKRSVETRPETNQDIKFLEKKKCSVCLETWKEILLEGKHLVFTKCGHVFCRDCALRFASEGRRECPLCKKSLRGVNPPFRRLHMPLDPRLKESRAK